MELDQGSEKPITNLVASKARGHVRKVKNLKVEILKLIITLKSDGIKSIVGVNDSQLQYTKMRRFSLRYLSPLLDQKPMQSDFSDTLTEILELQSETSNEVSRESTRRRIRSTDTETSVRSTDKMISEHVL